MSYSGTGTAPALASEHVSEFVYQVPGSAAPLLGDGKHGSAETSREQTDSLPRVSEKELARLAHILLIAQKVLSYVHFILG